MGETKVDPIGRTTSLPVLDEATGRFKIRRAPAGWEGVRCQSQEHIDGMLHHLFRGPVALRYVWLDGLSGPVDLRPWWTCSFCGCNPKTSRAGGCALCQGAEAPISLVIAGGRKDPLHPDWVRSLRDACTSAGVAFVFTGWGEWLPVSRPTDADEIVAAFNAYPRGRWLEPDGSSIHKTWDCVRVDRLGKKSAGRLLDGREWSQFPATASSPVTPSPISRDATGGRSS